MPFPALFTFGYEGLTIDDFIARLKDARVNLIVDVRELPLSRKKGFSKSAFREHLAAAGIGYEHRPALGCPKPVRDQYRADSDWTSCCRRGSSASPSAAWAPRPRDRFAAGGSGGRVCSGDRNGVAG